MNRSIHTHTQSSIRFALGQEIRHQEKRLFTMIVILADKELKYLRNRVPLVLTAI